MSNDDRYLEAYRSVYALVFSEEQAPTEPSGSVAAEPDPGLREVGRLEPWGPRGDVPPPRHRAGRESRRETRQPQPRRPRPGLVGDLQVG